MATLGEAGEVRAEATHGAARQGQPPTFAGLPEVCWFTSSQASSVAPHSLSSIHHLSLHDPPKSSAHSELMLKQYDRPEKRASPQFEFRHQRSLSVLSPASSLVDPTTDGTSSSRVESIFLSTVSSVSRNGSLQKAAAMAAPTDYSKSIASLNRSVSSASTITTSPGSEPVSPPPFRTQKTALSKCQEVSSTSSRPNETR